MRPILELLLYLSILIPTGADESGLKTIPPKIALMTQKPGAVAVQPGAAVKLNKGALYVISCTADCELLILPKGAASVQKKTGKRDYTAIFAGGTGDYEDRTFDGPFLYELKATSTGPATVTIIPVGFKDRSEWVELLLDCNNGARPPPVDPDNTDPQPFPTPAAKLKEGFVAFLYDDKGMPAPVAKLLGDTDWFRSLENVPGVLDCRKYDITLAEANNDALKKGYLDEANKFRTAKGVTDWKQPVMLVISKSAKVVDIRFMPTASKAAVESAIKEVIRP